MRTTSVRRVLLTRFSAVHIGSPVQPIRYHPDLFLASRMETRLRLFELATLPSVLSQSDRDFDWLVFIDRNMPQRYRDRLTALVEAHEHITIFELPPSQKFWRRSWLASLVPGTGEGALCTINLDDDDALPRHFMRDLGTLCEARLASGDATPLVLGYFEPLQWDMRFTADEPLGTIAPWHRRMWDGARYPSAAGLSQFNPDPGFDLTVWGTEHVSAQRALRPGFAPRSQHQRNGVRLLHAAASRARIDWRSLTPQRSFKALDEHTDAPMLLNHLFNEQHTRLSERKAVAWPLRGPEDIPNIALDWARLRDYVPRFAPT